MLTTSAGLSVPRPTPRQARAAGLPAALLALALLAAPAPASEPLPPPVQVRNLGSVAGAWEGLAEYRSGQRFRITWTIREDGTWENATWNDHGTIRVEGGRLLYANRVTKETGALVLHEGGGRRTLKGGSDDGRYSVLLAPLQPAAVPSPKAARVAALGVNPLGVEFDEGLRAAGYTVGQDVLLDVRVVNPPGLAEAAAAMVERKPDVIVAISTPAAVAAKRATAMIPIVFISLDPVVAGLVPSLARPGGNLTGVSAMSPELGGKRLELLRESVPGLRRVAVLANPDHPATAAQLRDLQDAARALGLELRLLEQRRFEEIEPAIGTAARERLGGLVVLPDAVTVARLSDVAELATGNGLAAITEHGGFARAGGLMAYGADYRHLFRQAAAYVGRILKGARPGDLPVEQPTRFALVVNLRTARALGLTIPPSVLLRADEVIQ